MAISPGAQTSTATGTSGLTTVITTPACSAGDRLVAFVSSLAGGTTLTGPAGWVLEKEFAPTTNLRSAVYSRVATGTEAASYTWTWSVSGRNVGEIKVYPGVDPAYVLDVDAKQGQDDSVGPHAAPAVTVPDGGWLITAVAARQSPGTAGPVTWTINVGTDAERFDLTSVNTGTGAQLPTAFYDSNAPLTASAGAPTSAPAPLNAYNELWAGSGAMRVGVTVDEKMVPAWQPRFNGLDWMRIFPNGDGLPPDWTASKLDPRYQMVKDFGAEPFLSSKVDGSSTKLAQLKDMLEAMPSWVSRVWITDRHEPEGDIEGGATAYKANIGKFFDMINTLSSAKRAKVWEGHVLTSQWTENYSGRSYATHDTGRGRFFGIDKYLNSWAPGTSSALVKFPTTSAEVKAWLNRIFTYRYNSSDTRPRAFPELGGIGAPFDTSGAARAAFYRAVDAELRTWGPSNTAWQGEFLGYILWGKQGKSGNAVKGIGELRWFTLDAHHNGKPYTYTKTINGKPTVVTDPEGGFDLLPNEAVSGGGGGGGSVPTARQVTSSVQTAVAHVWAIALKPSAAPPTTSAGNAWSAAGAVPLP